MAKKKVDPLQLADETSEAFTLQAEEEAAGNESLSK